MTAILVLGSEGTIGRPLVAGLTKRGYDVTTADLVHTNRPNHARCDVSRYRQIKKLFDQNEFEFVYNLAAEFGKKNGEDFYEQLWSSGVVGLKNLLDIQKKKKFRMVHFSSSEIYGSIEPPTGFLREDLSETMSLFQENDYAISKWVNELQIRNAHTKTMVIRLFNSYGPGEYYTPYRSVVSLFIYRALHDLPYNVYLDYHRVFMHSDDLVRTLCNLESHFKSGETYNIGGEEYVEVKKVSDMILKYLGKDDSLVTYLEKDVHSVTNKRPDIAKAKRDLGHKLLVPLSVGIPQTIEWQKKVYFGEKTCSRT